MNKPIHVTDSKISHEYVMVDPTIAKQWLDHHNRHNRKISELRTNDYVADMQAGRWKFNGETLQFDKFGKLLNGQHRLAAIVASGLAQPFLIVRGPESDAQLTMDQGTRRSPSEQLSLAGVISDSSVAAAIRTYIRWHRGLLFGDHVKQKLTTSEIVRWAQDNPSLVEILRDLSNAGVRRAPCAPSISLAIGLGFSLIDEIDCARFFGMLISGAGLTATSPILALRARLLASRDKGAKLTERDLVGFFIITWNAWRGGRGMVKLQRPRGGAWFASTFPKLKP